MISRPALLTSLAYADGPNFPSCKLSKANIGGATMLTPFALYSLSVFKEGRSLTVSAAS